jgi:NAD(P)-dependent dehydrogenase (short-subunit alcohol dehydrogenase family)
MTQCTMDTKTEGVLAPAGVDVTVMLPGSVDTPVIDDLGLHGAALPIRPQPAEAAVRETITAFLKQSRARTRSYRPDPTRPAGREQ